MRALLLLATAIGCDDIRNGACNQPIACRCGGTTEDPYQALAAAHPACP